MIKSFFVNPEEHRFRALWRILFQILLMLVIVGVPLYGLTELLNNFYKSGYIDWSPEFFDKVMDIIAGVLVTVLILLSVFLAGKWFDHRKFSDFGFRINLFWWKQYLSGVMLGIFLMTFVFAIEFFAGWININGYFKVANTGLPLWLSFIYPVIKDLCVGVYEEVISRGYQVTNMKEGFLGLWGLNEKKSYLLSIILSAVVFGFLHIRNPNASIQSIINITVVGFLLGVAYWFSGQMALPIGLHTAWNLAQGWLFGFSVSGDPEIANIIHIQQNGPDWITGGKFGPEAGLLGLAASIIGILILLFGRYVFQNRKSKKD